MPLELASLSRGSEGSPLVPHRRAWVILGFSSLYNPPHSSFRFLDVLGLWSLATPLQPAASKPSSPATPFIRRRATRSCSAPSLEDGTSYPLAKRQAKKASYKGNVERREKPVLTQEQKDAEKCRELQRKDRYALGQARVAENHAAKAAKSAASKEETLRRKLAKAARKALNKVANAGPAPGALLPAAAAAPLAPLPAAPVAALPAAPAVALAAAPLAPLPAAPVAALPAAPAVALAVAPLAPLPAAPVAALPLDGDASLFSKMFDAVLEVEK